MARETIWIVALNDGEAAEVVRLLTDYRQVVLVSAQAWGARWDGLESEIEDLLLAEGPQKVYGIELQGPDRWGAVNIDHHRYGESDDRWRPESALEQVASLLGVRLTRWQELVAANDRGYIPAMEHLNATPEEIAAVRLHDRRMQGITATDEARARDEVSGAEWRGRLARVLCTGRATSAHSDLLYGRADEVLMTGPGNWEYTGPRHRQLSRLCAPGEKWWSGGSAESGYFEVASPGEATRQRIEEEFWNG